MDSGTSSPIEPQNSIVKEKHGVNKKIDINRDIERVADTTNRTIQKHKDALRSLSKANFTSMSPTKNKFIEVEGTS